MMASIVPSLSEPLADFVRDARVQLALLIEPSGRVLAQHGFTRSMDVMSACALAAAIHASSSELGRELGGGPFGPLHHAGETRQFFLAPVSSAGATVLLLAVFDGTTSFGIVRIFWNEFSRRAVAAALPPTPEASALDFERDLQRNLAILFGRA